jgi:hypothetical protein
MSPDINRGMLARRWLHAHEEDAPGHRVFRPDSHPLPPSRGRTGYDLQPDGRAVKVGPGATDRSVAAQGTWTLDAQGRVVVRIPGQPDEVLDVVSIDADRLVVKK